MTRSCRRCGHPRSEHRHHRPGADCGRCGCPAWTWRPWASWEEVRELRAAVTRPSTAHHVSEIGERVALDKVHELHHTIAALAPPERVIAAANLIRRDIREAIDYCYGELGGKADTPEDVRPVEQSITEDMALLLDWIASVAGDPALARAVAAARYLVDRDDDGPRCRYCGADCSNGRSWDGGDLYACGPCSDARAKANRLRRDGQRLAAVDPDGDHGVDGATGERWARPE